MAPRCSVWLAERMVVPLQKQVGKKENLFRKETLTGLEYVEFEIAKRCPEGAVQRQSKVLPGSSGE